MARSLLVLLVLLAAPASAAQAPVRPEDDEELTILAFVSAVETAISTMDRTRWLDLHSSLADTGQATEFFDAMVPQGITRVVMKERDRTPLLGTLPGEGYRLVTEVFMETGPRGRIATWRLDIRRPRGDDLGPQPWRIVAEDRLASIEGLHRLSLHAERQFAARNLVVKAVDFELRLPAGDVFVAETPEGVTGLVLMGEGTMVFQPAPKAERGQLKIFAGTESLDTPFTIAFVRLNPFEFEQRVATAMIEPVPVDPRARPPAQGGLGPEVGQNISHNQSAQSPETWSLLPQPGDFVAEVRTRRHDRLTYARASGEPEDVSLFHRATKRNIAVYASTQKMSSRGRFYDEDNLTEYDVIDYEVDTAFQPDRDWLDGRTRLRLRVKAFALGVLTLRLAETLNVSSVTSDELGRLLFLRVSNQTGIVVNLPTPVARDFILTLTVAYSGRIPRQGPLDESVEVAADQGAQRNQPEEIPYAPAEPKWLFSNRSYWYPQGAVTDYATSTMRVTVPSAYTVVGSGMVAGAPVPVGPAGPDMPARSQFTFVTGQPVRYLAIVVSRLNPIDAATVALDILPAFAKASAGQASPKPRALSPQSPPAIGTRNTIQLDVQANKRQEARGRNATSTAAEILRLYAALMGDVPYDALTLALVEDERPGGHAPAYFAMLNNPPPVSSISWRNDPATFTNFPEFFMAHELAHQWFGQAVGWKNYHEQWLSEGFAQYFAALYAREQRGEAAFRNILRQFQRWSISQSDQGPVYLGYRLGHIKSDTRVFRALVYNKGAAVLHMLRQLVGDEAFFKGLRRYYAENRFKKAGTDDLRRAMEAESGRSLDRFFDRWIYDNEVPHLRFFSMLEGQELLVRFEQTGDIFDVPVTVTVTYTDGKTADHVVLATEAASTARLPVTGTIRSVDVNQDGGAVAVIERKQ